MWQPLPPIDGISICIKVVSITLHVLIILLGALHVLLVLKTSLLFSFFLPPSCHLYIISLFFFLFHITLRMKISISTDTSVLGFYGDIGYIGYIGYIGDISDISVDIFT